MDGTLVRYGHVVAAFLYVAALFAAHLLVIAARRAPDWRLRAPLHEQAARLSTWFALGSLLVIGALGNKLGMEMGYRMADTITFRVANGLWLASLVLLLVLELPASRKLAALARAAANAADRGDGSAGEPVDWKSTLTRWRIGNGLQLVVVVITLYYMVSPWR